MQQNGLLFAGQSGVALTWMNAYIDGKPVTPRIGMPVEVNALWYNAIMFSLDLAKAAKDTIFSKQWKSVAESIKKSFCQGFWSNEKDILPITLTIALKIGR